MISTTPGQAEHDAEHWWQATIQAVTQAIQNVVAPFFEELVELDLPQGWVT